MHNTARVISLSAWKAAHPKPAPQPVTPLDVALWWAEMWAAYLRGLRG